MTKGNMVMGGKEDTYQEIVGYLHTQFGGWDQICV